MASVSDAATLANFWKRHPDAVAQAALVALGLLVFHPALSPNVVFFERDIGFWWYPQVESLVRCVAEGTWPVWNPYFSFGLPMWEDPGYQLAYPPTWLNLVLMPATYYKLFVLAHWWLGAAGVYALLRAAGAGSLASFTGGAVFGLSGPFTSAVTLNHHYASLSWMGWVLFGVVRVLERASSGRALTLGAMAGLLALAGSADVAVMTAALALGMVAARDGAWRDRASIRGLALAAVFATAIAAVQWLPTITYVRAVGSRLAFAAESNLFWSVHPASLVDLLVPRLMADVRQSASLRDRLFESREPFLSSLFLGVPAAGFVLLATVARRDRIARIAAVFLVLAVVVSLGRYTPIVPWLLNLRLLAIFRYPVKALFAAAVLWAFLTGLGVEVWRRDWGPRERRVAAGIAVFLLALAAACLAASYGLQSGRLDAWLATPASKGGAEPAPFRLAVAAAGAGLTAGLLLLRRAREAWRHPTAVAMAAAALVDLGAVAQKTNEYMPATLFDAPPALLSALDRPLDHRRVQFEMGSRQWDVSGAPAAWDPHWSWTRGAQDALVPPAPSRWRLAGALDGDFNGLTPAPLPLMSQVLGQAQTNPVGMRLLQLGAVEYYVSLARQDAEGLRPLAAVPSVFREPIHLYRVVGALPRAYVVGQARILGAGEDALRTLLDPAFEPNTEVLLDDGEPLRATTAFQGRARIVERTFRGAAFDVEATADGYLVLVETMAPGWRARVGGEPTPIVRANAAFRAVRVPAGRHRVEMEYAPVAVWWGLALHGAALASAAAWALAHRH